MVVKYSDGTADDAFTVSESDGDFCSYTREIGNGVEVSLEWIKGSWDSECSFYIRNANGNIIYSREEDLSSGFLYSWINDCSFKNYNYEMCDAVQNLEVESQYPVAIKWNAPESGNVSYYEVYRDTRFLGTTEELSFSDETATGTFNYEYSVRPIYNDCTGYLSYVNIEHIDDAINENNSINASVYPNPSDNDFTIVCDKMTRISVYNVMGSMIWDKQVNNDKYIIKGLDSGIYFINIETSKGSVVRKVVKF